MITVTGSGSNIDVDKASLLVTGLHIARRHLVGGEQLQRPPLRTATLRREPLSTHWFLENISDAGQATES